MKKMNLIFAVLFSIFSLCAFAAITPASDSMHYGVTKNANALKATAQSSAIVVTNCSDEAVNVFAQFTDGSQKGMVLESVDNAPYNVISIDNPYPYVMIQVSAMDGDILYPMQQVFPGQHVNVGCGAPLGKSASTFVTVK